MGGGGGFIAVAPKADGDYVLRIGADPGGPPLEHNARWVPDVDAGGGGLRYPRQDGDVGSARFTLDLVNGANADPGAGKLRFSTPLPGNWYDSTNIYLSGEDADGVLLTSLFASAFTSPLASMLVISLEDDPASWASWTSTPPGIVVGPVTSPGYYDMLTGASDNGGTGTFAGWVDGATVVVSWTTRELAGATGPAGPTGPPGGGSGLPIYRGLVGTQDGANTTFTVQDGYSFQDFTIPSAAVYKNGLLMEPGLDITVTDALTVVFAAGQEPEGIDVLIMHGWFTAP
jgi:hypothetical protein